MRRPLAAATPGSAPGAQDLSPRSGTSVTGTACWRVAMRVCRWPADRKAEPGEKCGLPFEKFAEDAYNMRAICETEACCAHIPARGFVPGLVDAHIADQAHCVYLPNGDALVDYIGAAEDLDAAWVDIVAAINDRAAASFEALPVKNPNGRGPAEDGGVRHTCDGDNVLSMITRENAYALARQYAHDVVTLGYAAVE